MGTWLAKVTIPVRAETRTEAWRIMQQEMAKFDGNVESISLKPDDEEWTPHWQEA